MTFSRQQQIPSVIVKFGGCWKIAAHFVGKQLEDPPNLKLVAIWPVLNDPPIPATGI